MQARGRRGNGARRAREHRLVIGPVLFVDRALARDVGRQRHLAFPRDGGVQFRAGKRKGDIDFAAADMAKDVCLQAVPQTQLVPSGELSRRTGKGAPPVRGQPAMQKQFDLGGQPIGPP